METSNFPREEGFRQFVRTLGRRYHNPYAGNEAAHADFAAGWRYAAELCGQPQLAGLPDGASGACVRVGHRYDLGLMPSLASSRTARRRAAG